MLETQMNLVLIRYVQDMGVYHIYRLLQTFRLRRIQSRCIRQTVGIPSGKHQSEEHSMTHEIDHI